MAITAFVDFEHRHRKLLCVVLTHHLLQNLSYLIEHCLISLERRFVRSPLRENGAKHTARERATTSLSLSAIFGLDYLPNCTAVLRVIILGNRVLKVKNVGHLPHEGRFGFVISA